MMKSGIFAYLISRNIDLYDNKFVNIYSKSENYNNSINYMCGRYDITPSHPPAVVDGKNSTAWASLDLYSEKDKSILFDFNNIKLYVDTFANETTCGSPKQVALEGSNDKGATWDSFCVSDSSSVFQNFTVTYINCTNPGYFKMFRFRQIGSNTAASTHFRFLIFNLEFYGSMFFKPITCKKQFFINHFIIMFFTSILIFYG